MKIKFICFFRRHKSLQSMCAVLSLLLLFVLYSLSKDMHKYANEDVFLPRQLRGYLKFGEEPTAMDSSWSDSVPGLRAMLQHLTYDECRVAHANRFLAVTRDTTILVVRVHADLHRLQYLVLSLARVKYIETTLLVFSHSFYDSKINKLIESIDFCKVMQIFYPYSVQANPNRFPGVSPQDCPESIDASQPTVTCFGRSARLVESKHHWWWTAHHVFEALEWSSIHRGLVIFLEENQYVSPDLLHVVQYAQRVFSYMSYVHVIDLGINNSGAQGAQDYSALQIQEWKPAENVMLAFNSTVWRQVVTFGTHYCMYNDVSWSLSLNNVFSKFPRGHAMAVTTYVPRVLSLGHGSRDDTNVQLAAQEAWRRMRGPRLFPKRVRCSSVWDRDPLRTTLSEAPRGGFADIHDRVFCINMLSAAAQDVLLDDDVALKTQLSSVLNKYIAVI